MYGPVVGSLSRAGRFSRASMTRAYALGLGYGTLWLVGACLAFGLLDAVVISTTRKGAVLSVIGLSLVGGALLVQCFRFLRLASLAPRTGSGRLSIRKRRIVAGLIVLEIIGWTAVNVTLGQGHQSVWIVPIDLLIIGAHFLPLALVFRVPAYLLMGSLWLMAIVGSLLILSPSTVVGHASAWTTMPSVVCIAITWLTVYFLLASETRRFRREVPSRVVGTVIA